MEDINVEWFFKMPGLLIVIGVILILVSLLIFIISNSGKKKEQKPKVIEEEQKPINANLEGNALPTETIPSIQQANDVNVAPTQVVDVTPIVNTTSTPNLADSVQSVITPNVEPSNITSTETIEPTVNIIPTIVEPTMVEPTIDNVANVTIPTIQNPIMQEKVPVNDINVQDVQEFTPGNINTDLNKDDTDDLI